MFLALLEQETIALEEDHTDFVLDFISGAYDESEYHMIKEEFNLDDDEYESILEMVRHVSSTGAVSKTQNRAVRKIRAGMTTGMTAQQRRMRAMKAARTKARNPAILRRAMKKRAKAMNKRHVMGIRSGT